MNLNDQRQLHILKSYGIEPSQENLEQSFKKGLIDEDLFVKASEQLDIIKGGKKANVGETRTFGGREYIKTAGGWKFHGKGGGAKAKEHKAGAEKHAAENPTSDKPAGEEKSVQDHAKEASEASLNKTIKESPDAKLRQAAHNELERRKKEEYPEDKKDQKKEVKKEKVKEALEKHSSEKKEVEAPLGTISTGKKVYLEGTHKDHKDFTPAEHREAGDMIVGLFSSDKIDVRQGDESAMHHYRQADLKEKEAKKIAATARMKEQMSNIKEKISSFDEYLDSRHGFSANNEMRRDLKIAMEEFEKQAKIITDKIGADHELEFIFDPTRDPKYPSFSFAVGFNKFRLKDKYPDEYKNASAGLASGKLENFAASQGGKILKEAGLFPGKSYGQSGYTHNNSAVGFSTITKPGATYRMTIDKVI